MLTTKHPDFALQEVLTDAFGQDRRHLNIQSHSVLSVETLKDAGQILCAFEHHADRVVCKLYATHSRFDFRQLLLDGLKEFEGKTGIKVEVSEQFAGPIPTTRVHPLVSIVQRVRSWYEDHSGIIQILIGVAAISVFVGALAVSAWLSPWRP